MIDFQGYKYATAAEVAEYTKLLNEKDRQHITEMRERDTATVKAFAAQVEGCELVYWKTDQTRDGWSWNPCISYDGVVMHVNHWDLDKRKTVSLDAMAGPQLNVCALRDMPAVKSIKDSQPQKVGAPTAKKLQAWADWNRRLLKAMEDLTDERAARRAESVAKVQAVEGVRVIVEGRQYRLTRGAVEVEIYIGDDGHIRHDYSVGRRAAAELFADVM